jgi:hypothetical protein
MAMKQCTSCGAINSDHRSVCVDCGKRLGKPLSEEQANAVEEHLRKNTEKLYQGEDPLHIGLLDKIIGGLCILGLFLGLCLWLFGFVKEDGVGTAIGGLLAFFFGALESLAPELMWELEEMRLELFICDTTPGGMYLVFRRVAQVLTFLIGVVAFLIALFG